MGFLSVMMLCMFLAASSAEANNFIVGGKSGWSTRPSQDYTQWSGRLRFLINDTLSFKYSKDTDSVVVVNKDDYDKCNAANPISKFDGGDSTFKFDRSGPFYFITSNKTNCDQGQKLLVVVLALRNKSPPSPAPVPAGQAPTTSPSSDSPDVSPSPATSAPAANGPGTNATPTPLSPGNTPSDISSPPGQSKSSAPAVSPAGVVSVVMTVALAAIITFT